MYPNLYYAFKDLFGVDEKWKFLRFVNSFGFFVALAFVAAAIILANELKRKSKQGLLQYEEAKIVVGKPASAAELLINFVLGFLLGYKIIGAFISDSPLTANPPDFIFSLEGSWTMGILLGLLFTGLKWWEKNKEKLAKPEVRTIRIWPHDRVGDIVISAAIFGFLGAKIFHNLENWDELVKDPLGSLLSFSGLTFYGGLICAALAIWRYARKHGIGIWHLNDAAAPALMLAYSIGRIGCQVSGDGDWGVLNSAFISNADGTVSSANTQQFSSALQANNDFFARQFGSIEKVHHISFPAPSFLPDWMVAYTYPHNVINEGINFADCAGQYCAYLPVPVFPTPFYETIACFFLFIIIWALRKKVKVPGAIFAIYLILNGAERFFVEKIRINTTYSIFGFHPTQAEIISFFLVVIGIALLFILKKRYETHKKIA
ncbi:MAG: prolipoprotein diacylglyceryl transferase family protein [Chitinophagaceae bacterium]